MALTMMCKVCQGTGEILMPVGKNIKRIRNSVNITQDQLAELVGMSRPSLVNIECGRQSLNAQQLIAFSRVLEVSADVLLGLVDGTAEAPANA